MRRRSGEEGSLALSDTIDDIGRIDLAMAMAADKLKQPSPPLRGVTTAEGGSSAQMRPFPPPSEASSSSSRPPPITPTVPESPTVCESPRITHTVSCQTDKEEEEEELRATVEPPSYTHAAAT